MEFVLAMRSTLLRNSASHLLKISLFSSATMNHRLMWSAVIRLTRRSQRSRSGRGQAQAVGYWTSSTPAKTLSQKPRPSRQPGETINLLGQTDPFGLENYLALSSAVAELRRRA